MNDQEAKEYARAFSIAYPPKCKNCRDSGVEFRPSSDGEEAHEYPCSLNCEAVKELDPQLWEKRELAKEPKCTCHPDMVGENLDNCPKCYAEYEASERAAAEANPHL